MTLLFVALTSLAATLAPVGPQAIGVLPVVSKPLAGRWSAAFASAPACAQLRRVALPAHQASLAAACGIDVACLAGAARGGPAALVAGAVVRFDSGGYFLELAVVDVAQAIAVATFRSGPADSASALGAALVDGAGRACAAASTLASAEDDLSLDLDLPAVPQLPAALDEADEDLDLELAPLASVQPPVSDEFHSVAALPEPTRSPEFEAIVAARPPPRVLAVGEGTAPRSTGSSRVAPWVAGAVTVIAAGGGTWFGTSALSAARTRDGAADSRAFQTAQDAAASSATRANVSWGVAAGAAVTAAVLWFTSDEETPAP